ncbi:hypothetical protein V6Z12_D11G322700 [Gossypium hirsutum]
MLLVHLPISVRSIIFSFQIFVFFFKTISIYHQQTLINLFLPSHTLLISLPPHFRFNLVLLPFHLRLVLPPLQGPLRPVGELSDMRLLPPQKLMIFGGDSPQMREELYPLYLWPLYPLPIYFVYRHKLHRS